MGYPGGERMQADTEMLARAAGMAGAVADQIDTQRTHLAGLIGQVRGYWDSPAVAALEGVWEKWDAEAVKLIVDLRDLGDGTFFANGTYELAEQDITADINATQGMGAFGALHT